MGELRLLLIEDDRALREAIAGALSGAGYAVRTEADGTRLAEVLQGLDPDLAIVDVSLAAGPDGFELCTRIRATGVPVILVSEAGPLEDKLRGFEIGADDYLVKPVPMAELLARVAVALRRAGRFGVTPWRAGSLTFDDAARTVMHEGQTVALTKVEYDLLATLAATPGRVFSKPRLLAAVWGFDDYDPNVVEVHVSSLRRKLESHGPRCVHTERGRGYVFR